MKIRHIRIIVPGGAKGKILKSDLPLSFLGGVDPETGQITEEGHALRGETITRVIFALPHSKGSTVGSYVLYSLATHGVAPLAILMKKMDMVTATGCVLGGIPLAIVTERTWSGLKNGASAELSADSPTLRLSE
jgi:predicted aconitase with swiveling domain